MNSFNTTVVRDGLNPGQLSFEIKKSDDGLQFAEPESNENRNQNNVEIQHEISWLEKPGPGNFPPNVIPNLTDLISRCGVEVAYF